MNKNLLVLTLLAGITAVTIIAAALAYNVEVVMATDLTAPNNRPTSH